MTYKLILLLPLFGAFLSGIFPSLLGQKLSQLVPTLLVSLVALLSIFVFFADYGNVAVIYPLFSWISIADIHIDWAIRSDGLTRMMLPVVTIVSSLVHIYSFGYMQEDPSKSRFFSYLSLFTFMMLALITSNNFLQLFFGWEGVGLASYLLIGFWFHKPSACDASMKAFIVNRVADFAFILGLSLVYIYVSSMDASLLPSSTSNIFDYDVVFSSVPFLKSQTINLLGISVLDMVCLLLFIGAMGKSAQFILHVWLPDAMEGPTPVSALIHAATMVTAGVFLVCRASFMFEHVSPFVSGFITIIGAVTCLFSATVAMTQFDIKRVIAYSTCSQLGYMFFAAGVGAYQAALFHLFTHAFFKAMLFLGAGSVIHAMHHEQDMRNMGGLWRRIKPTAILMLIGTIAITGLGIPIIFGHGVGFAGFYSKDMILETAAASPRLFSDFAFFIGVFVAFLTSFYSWRLMFLVFFGSSRGSDKIHAHAHEAPLIMAFPVMLLATGAIFSGGFFYNDFVGSSMNDFWAGSIFNLTSGGENIIEKAHHVSALVKFSPLIASLLGLWLSYIFYIRSPQIPSILIKDFGFFYRILHNKWYIDEIYHFVFLRPYQKISKFFADIIDFGVIDKVICGLVVWNVKKTGDIGSRLHSGFLYHYAFSMLLGVVVMIFMLIIGGI